MHQATDLGNAKGGAGRHLRPDNRPHRAVGYLRLCLLRSGRDFLSQTLRIRLNTSPPVCPP